MKILVWAVFLPIVKLGAKTNWLITEKAQKAVSKLYWFFKKVNRTFFQSIEVFRKSIHFQKVMNTKVQAKKKSAEEKFIRAYMQHFRLLKYSNILYRVKIWAKSRWFSASGCNQYISQPAVLINWSISFDNRSKSLIDNWLSSKPNLLKSMEFHSPANNFFLSSSRAINVPLSSKLIDWIFSAIAGPRQ